MAAATPTVHQVPLGQPEHFYIPELDSLRFSAFLAVFFAHSSLLLKPRFAPFPGILPALAEAGAFGVDLFFVLSAYLLATLLLREKARTGRVHIRAFYLRRGLRIWPLYFAFLASVFLMTKFRFGPAPMPVLGFAIFLGNYTCFLNPSITPLVSPLWSISLEEQFYAVLPWATRKASPRGLIAFAAAIWLSSIGCRIWLFEGAAHSDPARIWYFPLAHLDSIACGVLIALLSDSLGSIPLNSRIGLIVVGAALWLWAGAMLPHSPAVGLPGVVSSYLLAALGCGAVVLGTIGSTNRLAHHPWLIYLGKISYGLYVFHTGALILAVRMLAGAPRWAFLPLCPLLALAGAIAIAALSYAVLESPFLRLKHRFEYVRH